MKAPLVTDEELQHIENMLEGLESQIVQSMLYIKKVQGWTNDTLANRFSGISNKVLLRYLQKAHTGIRPIHFVAVFSWLTMIPMTAFYLGTKIRESYRGMDKLAVDALLCIGNMPYEQFDIVLSCIYLYLDQAGKDAVDKLRAELTKEYGVIDAEFEKKHLPPDVIDLKEFAESYYHSVALTAKELREEYKLSEREMGEIVGLSRYKYKVLENPNDPQPFSLAIGIRAKLGLKLTGHVNFTKEMTHYSEFHGFRKLQHIRDSLLVESLQHVPVHQKDYVVEMIKGISNAYIKKRMEKRI
ncbi:hypothetical protein [Marinomonas transparens]|uniref:Uncharacterized protein n=1 Tax=Marinomonas transparens TaxID=2795388 RepID=A0A934JLF9_9GAMM|nr:hypothetical protein [Marinomonas transparens]MBJ7536533.1 hypothetical protein [Marinomonas transparens]